MLRYLLIATVVILAIIVVRLPARPLIERLPSGAAELSQPAGTLWRGTGRLTVNGQGLGVLSWSIDPLALLRLKLAADLIVDGPELALNGAAAIGADRQFTAQLDGEIGNPLLNTVLAPYAIRIDGDLKVQALDVTGTLVDLGGQSRALEDVITFASLSGQLHWDGGLASYTLQGGTSTTPFPELEGNLGLSAEQLPELVVYSGSSEAALLRTSVVTQGFVKVGVSRRFTALAGMPWPSPGPDDEIVLEVEQQVF